MKILLILDLAEIQEIERVLLLYRAHCEANNDDRELFTHDLQHARAAQDILHKGLMHSMFRKIPELPKI